MKKSIPKVWERESEASILGNDREQEFPLTPEKYWQLFLNSQRMFTHGKDTLKLDKSYQLVGCTAGK